jgi:hypothetical protein
MKTLELIQLQGFFLLRDFFGLFIIKLPKKTGENTLKTTGMLLLN